MDLNGRKSTPYIVDILHQHGIDQVVICPGSRNAPLTLAFARHGKFNCLSIIDERSAGYFALGLAKAIKKPVAIICTSGTAVLNLAPSIAEAFHQQVPLIVLTADRPDAWIYQQDGQAIHQKNIYSNFIAASYSLRGELYHAEDLWQTERITNEAFHIATSQSQPVHINVSFSEPLYDENYNQVNAKKIDQFEAKTFYSHWENVLADKKNMLLVLGQCDFDQAILDAIATINIYPNVVVVGENLCNVSSSYLVSNASEAVYFANEKMKPDVIIYVGGPIVAKQLKKYLTLQNVPVIRVQESNTEVDTFKGNVAIIKQSSVDAIETLADYTSQQNISSEFSSEWKLASEKAKRCREEFLSTISFTDLKIFEFLAKKIPGLSIIHLGNSTPVRYAQLFNDVFREDICFFANRGTSGIDGATSTAVGFCFASDRLNFLVTGDLSFQYDANAFFNNYLKGNLKVIIINNSGGNIFRVIDGPREQKEREEFFETSTKHEFSNLAKHFDLNYFSAKDEQSLEVSWREFIIHSNRPSVLEIFSDAEISANTFKEFYKNLQQ
jgi:2-succinyl-5-enolpyruvyl-6-hydroxy-3-cyclohexene-1-carboxylate synthase